jgi:hypothetical protein
MVVRYENDQSIGHGLADDDPVEGIPDDSGRRESSRTAGLSIGNDSISWWVRLLLKNRAEIPEGEACPIHA